MGEHPAPHSCVESLLTLETLEVLDLSWNAFTVDVQVVVGRAVAQHPRIKSLYFANCAGSSEADGFAPMADFFECLAWDRSLTFMDVSINRVNYRSALALEEALAHHEKIRELKLTNSPLGVGGMRCLLRLLGRATCGLLRFDSQHCTDDVDLDADVFNATDPSGSYELDLSSAFHRATLRMLYETCDRFGLLPARAFCDVEFTLGAQPAQSKKGKKAKTQEDRGIGSKNKKQKGATQRKPTIGKKDEAGHWIVPTSGAFRARFSLDEVWSTLLGKVSEPLSDIGEPMAEVYLNRYLFRVRLKLSFSKVVPLLVQWRSLSRMNVSGQMLVLKALSSDFILSLPTVYEFCNGPARVADVLANLFHCMTVAPLERFLAHILIPSLDHFLYVQRRCEPLQNFNCESPTGQYMLDLSDCVQCHIAQSVMLLDRWEATTAQRQGRMDVSMFGNWSNIRNCFHQNTQIQDLPNWHLRTSGTLTFDYSTWRRPPSNAPALQLNDATWQQLLSIFSSSILNSAMRVLVLRSISHRIFLSCLQLRELLQLVGNNQDRQHATCTFLLRVVDPENTKIIRAMLIMLDEWAAVNRMLGQLGFFPFYQPEHNKFNFALSTPEDHHAAHLVCQLAGKEGGASNIREPCLRRPDGTYFAFSMGVPLSWGLELSAVPNAGNWTLQYDASPEDRDFKYRKTLAAKFGGWQTDCEARAVHWWADLGSVPTPVVIFVQYLLRTFNFDIYQAFHEFDGPFPDEEISLNEMRDLAINQLKWRTFVREPELLDQVFRFLDPDNGGRISKAEWSVCSMIAKEFKLCIYELVKFIAREFQEDFAAAWKKIDDDESGAIDSEEWETAMKLIGYYGPHEDIFKLLADESSSRDGVRTITRDESGTSARYGRGWNVLEKCWSEKEAFFKSIVDAR